MSQSPLELSSLAPRVSAVDGCARVLRDTILAGKLLPGDRLPAERELAAQLGVNRTTLRGALGQLEAAGLLSVRQGSGTVVRDWRRAGGPELIADLVRLAGASGPRRVAGELLVLRRSLAATLLPRVIALASARQLKRLDAAIEAFERQVEAHARPPALAEADLDIVAVLVELAQGEVLGLCANPVLRLLGELPALAEALYRDPESNLRAWQALAALVRARALDQLPDVLEVLRQHDEGTLRRLAPGPRRARRPRAAAEERR